MKLRSGIFNEGELRRVHLFELSAKELEDHIMILKQIKAEGSDVDQKLAEANTEKLRRLVS